MSKEFLPISKGIAAPGEVDVKVGPFNSLTEFHTFMSDELFEYSQGMFVKIINNAGGTDLYWNPNGGQNFEKFASGSDTPTQSINVVDSLESDSITDALAAKQGKVLKTQIDTKMPSNQQFKTIGGQSIFGTGNIPTTSSGDLPTYQRHAIDMQPSCIMQTSRFELAVPMKAGVTYHVGCMNTTLEGTKYDAQAIGKITVAVKPIYIDGTTGSDPIIQLGWATADWNNTAPFREIEFTPTKDVVAWNVMGGKPNESQANPKYWYWHWDETVEKPSVW